MSDTAKRIERAEKALQKGKPDLALAEYLAILEEDSSNEAVYNTAADVCVSLGRNSEAVKLLDQLYDRQCTRSDKTKAALTYKKLSRITRPTGEQSLTFAHSLARNNDEALKAYEAALHSFASKGRTREALSALSGIVALAPSVDNLRKQAELAAELGLTQEAAAAYLSASELEKDEDSKFVLIERAYRLNPQDWKIADTHAEALLARKSPVKAAAIIEPFTLKGDYQKEARAIYGRAMLAANQPERAIRFLWEMLERDASCIGMVQDAISALAASDQTQAALDWVRKLEQREAKEGRRREFVTFVKSLAEKQTPGVELLEYMAEIFNAANREHDYCETLLKLFDLHYASGEYAKAANCLDHAAEVDAYETGHMSRLEMLKGKIDARQFKSVAERFSVVVVAPATASEVQEEKKEVESNVLEDLLIQAQIYFRYSMDAKAVEKLKQIQKLFPGEEQNSAELQEMYAKAGLLRRTPEPELDDEAPIERPARAAGEQAASASVDDIGRVTEITTNLYRQSTVKNVLFACVNDSGRHWNASRCLAVLCTPGKPPSIAVEYCAPGMSQSDIHTIVKLVSLLQPLSVAHGTINLSNPKSTKPVLRPLRKTVAAMGIQSLLAVPLVNAGEHIGLLVLSECKAVREWSTDDSSVLNAIAEQVVLAVANAKLRKLVRDLAVTEEKSGLVKRSSYMDVLLSETARGLQQKNPVTLMLMNFGKPADMVREAGPEGVDFMMRNIAALITSHVRQNDVAVRYDATTIALILTDTNGSNAMQAAEKLRKVAAVATIPGRDAPPRIAVGIAEAVMQPQFDAADVVTEVANRVERSLAQAFEVGENQTAILPPANDYLPAGV